MSDQIALVTGANRGIGLEVVHQLAKEGMSVYLGSRDIEKGRAAAEPLQQRGLNITACQLDVTTPGDIEKIAEQISQEHGRLDVLVNNAGILYDTWQTVLNADLSQAQVAFEINTLAPWRMVQTMLPLLRASAHGRVVNVSSGAGALEGMRGNTPAYSLSKAALNALTIMLAESLKAEKILVNAVCPGWVATDMGGAGGRPIEDGAASVVWAALLPDNGPTGGFFRDGKKISW
ncbi:MAG: SDR family oxidoreductase [Cyanobacteria bacterium J06632_3]